MIPEGKLRALHEALADGAVKFRNGSRITRTKIGGYSVRHGRSKVIRTFGVSDIEGAYNYALNGREPEDPPLPAPIRQLSGDGSEFGDTPPF